MMNPMAKTGPEQEKERLIEVYANMADGELEALAAAAEELTEEALVVLKLEMERRGIQFEQKTQPAGLNPDHPRLVTVARFRDLPQALMAKGALDSAGIESFLADTNFVRMDWFASNAVGGMRLQVREEDAKDAAEIVEQSIPENIVLDGQEVYSQPRCPNCQSLDIVFWTLSERKCSSCGHTWEQVAPD